MRCQHVYLFFGITSVDTHYTLSHLGIHVDAILVLVVVEGIVSIRDLSPPQFSIIFALDWILS